MDIRMSTRNNVILKQFYFEDEQLQLWQVGLANLEI